MNSQTVRQNSSLKSPSEAALRLRHEKAGDRARTKGGESKRMIERTSRILALQPSSPQLPKRLAEVRSRELKFNSPIVTRKLPYTFYYLTKCPSHLLHDLMTQKKASLTPAKKGRPASGKALRDRQISTSFTAYQERRLDEMAAALGLKSRSALISGVLELLIYQGSSSKALQRLQKALESEMDDYPSEVQLFEPRAILAQYTGKTTKNTK